MYTRTPPSPRHAAPRALRARDPQRRRRAGAGALGARARATSRDFGAKRRGSGAGASASAPSGAERTSRASRRRAGRRSRSVRLPPRAGGGAGRARAARAGRTHTTFHHQSIINLSSGEFSFITPSACFLCRSSVSHPCVYRDSTRHTLHAIYLFHICLMFVVCVFHFRVSFALFFCMFCLRIALSFPHSTSDNLLDPSLHSLHSVAYHYVPHTTLIPLLTHSTAEKLPIINFHSFRTVR